MSHRALPALFALSAALSCLSQPVAHAQAQARAADPNTAQITMEATVFHYGQVEYGANGMRSIKFKNTGKAPLVISSITTSCACLAVEFPKQPLAAGAWGEIRFNYDTKRAGVFSKTMTINSNAGPSPVLVFTVKGEVRADPSKASAMPKTPK